MAKPKLPYKNFAWSSELAYAVGLLVTDGNLSKDGRHITLRSCDLEQIRNFQICLRKYFDLNIAIGKSTPLGTNRKPCYRFQFSKVQFYQWLLKIGLFPAKTYTIDNIQIPDEYFRDFLRGHLDGDGTITVYQDHYNTFKDPAYIYTRLFVRFISVSKKHMIWLRSTIKRLTGAKGDFFEDIKKNDSCVSIWQLKFMKKEAIKLFDWIYYSPDVPCLTRKRKKIEQAIALIKTTRRKPYTKRMAISAGP